MEKDLYVTSERSKWPSHVSQMRRDLGHPAYIDIDLARHPQPEFIKAIQCELKPADRRRQSRNP
jgi:hypothetical protein